MKIHTRYPEQKRAETWFAPTIVAPLHRLLNNPPIIPSRQQALNPPSPSFSFHATHAAATEIGRAHV